MKYLKLNQIVRVSDELLTCSPIFINREMVKFFHEAKPNADEPPLTRLAMVGSDKTIDVMESPSQIEKMCRDIIGVEIVKPTA